MSVKYFDKEKGEWLVFPGVKGESAYEAAMKGGFTGTEEEFNKKLANTGNVNITIDDHPTSGSKNAVSSDGVYNEIKKINDAIENIDVSTQLGDYLTKREADSKYEPLMNASKELFKVKSQDGSVNPFTYGSTLDLSAIDVDVEVSDDYTVFAYHYSQANPGAPSGGGVDTSYSIVYPKDWHGSDKVDEWLNDDQDLNIWMSYATFIVGGDIIGSWSYPIKVAKDGKDGQPGSKGEDGIDGATGAGIEFVYCRVAGKKVTLFPSTIAKPDNSWGYDSPTGSWSDNPIGVNINNQTEWVCVRTKAEGSDSWGNWSNPALFSVFGEDGQDGGGFEYIFIRNNISDFNQERYKPVGTQEDDSIPSGWSDNALTPTKDEPYVWVSTRKKSSTWGDFSIPTLWTWYVKDGDKGDQGVAGAAGYTISTVYLYNRGNNTPELPKVNLQYDIQNNELYLNSESWNDNIWSLSVPASTGESSLYRTEAFVKTNTPDEYITINSNKWSPAVVIAMDGSNGEDGTGESATQVTIDPDAMLLPVKSNGNPHLAYTFKFNTKFFYGTSEQTIVKYTKFKTDDVNGVDLPNGIYSLSATYSENNVLYTAVIDINSTVVDPIIIPVTLSANINDAEISKKNSISIVPTVQENPVIYTIEPNKNQFKIYDGINEYLKVKAYRIDGDVKTEATDVILRYHYGDINDDNTIDINDWIVYPEEGINIQNENADVFGREIILGIFNDVDNTPMLQNVVTLVYDGQKGDNGYDGASREYMFKLSNDKPSIVNDLGELDLTGWTDNPTGISKDNPKEWYITRNKPFMGEWNSWEEAGVMLWSSYGEKGNDGPGFEYIYTATKSEDVPEVPVVEQVDDFDSFKGDRKGWVDDVISPTEDNPIIWVSTRKKSIVDNNMIWSNFSEPKVWNKYVKDGSDGADADSIGRIYVVGTEDEYVDRDPQTTIYENSFSFTEDNGVRRSYQECYNDIQNSDYWISSGYIYVWCLEYSYNIQQKKDPVLVNYYRMTPTIGAAGQTGKTIYPSGIYDTSINYVATSTAAPYVYNQIDKKYYIYNHEEPWFDILGDKDVPTSLSGYENDWIPMEGFNAIYTEIGIIENGTVGDAVFNKGKMFSKDGAYYNGSTFVETTENDGNYSLFGSYVDEANKTDDYYSNNHKFHPNTMIDFDSGKAVFGRGSVQLAKSSNDTSVFDSKVEVNNEFAAKYKDEDASDVVLSEVNVSPKLVIMRSTGGQVGEKVGSLEIKSIPNDNDIHFPEFYITAKDPRSDEVINSTVEGNDAIRSDYSRITLQEYINRCISNFLYGKTKDSYEILGISNYSLSIGSNSTETNVFEIHVDTSTSSSYGSYKWEGVVGSILYNTQTCTTVDASDLKWNCTVSQAPASGINISISNSKLLNGSAVLNSGVLSISGSTPTSLFLNTINSITGEEFNWTEATADVVLSPKDSSFVQTISLTIKRNE